MHLKIFALHLKINKLQCSFARFCTKVFIVGVHSRGLWGVFLLTLIFGSRYDFLDMTLFLNRAHPSIFQNTPLKFILFILSI